MKKRITLALTAMLLGISGVKSQTSDWWWFPGQTLEDGVTGAGIEMGYQITNADLGRTLGTTIGLNMYIYGAYIAFSSNFSEAEETEYGAGDQIDDEHNIKAFSLGYNFIIAQNMSYDVGLTPIFNFQVVEDRYTDSYYGEDLVANYHKKVGFGVALTLRGDNLMGHLKLSSSEIGFGVTLLLPDMSWMYYY